MTHTRRWAPFFVTVVLAHIFWFVSFSVEYGSHWINIALSATTLVILSKVLSRSKASCETWDKKTIVWGLGAAGVLYLIFWLGNFLSTLFLPFARQQITSIYGMGTDTPMWLMLVLSLFVTGPAEEFFWRGFVQSQLMDRFGKMQGWILGVVLYGSVHLWSCNVMLIAAAFVVGAFWGWLYWRFGKLLPAVICHSVWSALVFVIFPFG